MQPTVPDRGDADDQNINGGGARWSTETLVLLVLLVLLLQRRLDSLSFG